MRYFTLQEAATKIGISRNAVWYHVKKGIIPALNFPRADGSPRYRIAEDDLDRVVNRPEGTPISATVESAA